MSMVPRLRSSEVIYYHKIITDVIVLGIWEEGGGSQQNPLFSIPHIKVLSKRRKENFRGLQRQLGNSVHSVHQKQIHNVIEVAGLLGQGLLYTK